MPGFNLGGGGGASAVPSAEPSQGEFRADFSVYFSTALLGDFQPVAERANASVEVKDEERRRSADRRDGSL